MIRRWWYFIIDYFWYYIYYSRHLLHAPFTCYSPRVTTLVDNMTKSRSTFVFIFIDLSVMLAIEILYLLFRLLARWWHAAFHILPLRIISSRNPSAATGLYWWMAIDRKPASSMISRKSGQPCSHEKWPQHTLHASEQHNGCLLLMTVCHHWRDSFIYWYLRKFHARHGMLRPLVKPGIAFVL